jgi:hypothetical protein
MSSKVSALIGFQRTSRKQRVARLCCFLQQVIGVPFSLFARAKQLLAFSGSNVLTAAAAAALSLLLMVVLALPPVQAAAEGPPPSAGCWALVAPNAPSDGAADVKAAVNISGACGSDNGTASTGVGPHSLQLLWRPNRHCLQPGLHPMRPQESHLLAQLVFEAASRLKLWVAAHTFRCRWWPLMCCCALCWQCQ